MRSASNDNQEIDFYFRLPGQSWQKTRESAEVSGMHHNVLGGFLDLRPAVFAAGCGSASLRNFRYWPEAKAPAQLSPMIGARARSATVKIMPRETNARMITAREYTVRKTVSENSE
jgi:hypothetical protein